ncbi:MAG: hypothetical protein HQK52_00895 [Oligoflexia bacterium]|nr:hypothetical protein [Oligoflexia bacterium]
MIDTLFVNFFVLHFLFCVLVLLFSNKQNTEKKIILIYHAIETIICIAIVVLLGMIFATNESASAPISVKFFSSTWVLNLNHSNVFISALVYILYIIIKLVTPTKDLQLSSLLGMAMGLFFLQISSQNLLIFIFLSDLVFLLIFLIIKNNRREKDECSDYIDYITYGIMTILSALTFVFVIFIGIELSATKGHLFYRTMKFVINVFDFSQLESLNSELSKTCFAAFVIALVIKGPVVSYLRLLHGKKNNFYICIEDATYLIISCASCFYLLFALVPKSGSNTEIMQFMPMPYIGLLLFFLSIIDLFFKIREEGSQKGLINVFFVYLFLLIYLILESGSLLVEILIAKSILTVIIFTGIYFYFMFAKKILRFDGKLEKKCEQISHLGHFVFSLTKFSSFAWVIFFSMSLWIMDVIAVSYLIKESNVTGYLVLIILAFCFFYVMKKIVIVFAGVSKNIHIVSNSKLLIHGYALIVANISLSYGIYLILINLEKFSQNLYRIWQ